MPPLHLAATSDLLVNVKVLSLLFSDTVNLLFPKRFDPCNPPMRVD